MSDYQPIIGIECHVQLDTATKLFCRCPITHAAPANASICPTCTGQPGTLPALNEVAVRLAIRAGLAIGCTVQERSIFARKNYFYPDLPKGYQITQFDAPICTDGKLHVFMEGSQRVFGVTRLHMEEDAGKMIHGADGTLVDWNRAGTPLAEIVSEPDLRNASEAEAYARMLHRVMVSARVTQGDMNKGHMRFDANVSVHQPSEPWGSKVEIKNLNSFRFMRKAIEFEISRQVEVLENGGEIFQETRTWTGSTTETMRTKEGAADYRYFAEPDLPPLVVSESERKKQSAILETHPLDVHLLEKDAAQIEQWKTEFGLTEYEVSVLTSSVEVADFYRSTVAIGGHPKMMSNWVQSELLGLARAANVSISELQLTPQTLVDLQRLLDEEKINRPVAKKLLQQISISGGEVEQLVEEGGLGRLGDEPAIRSVVKAAIDSHPDQASRYREGNHKLAGFFMGEVMKATGGKADPQLANRLVKEELDAQE
jgi:aspartyl-tRNA(Asn)/glutamyl-tRNA(Gln) amidotransferase subunit B